MQYKYYEIFLQESYGKIGLMRIFFFNPPFGMYQRGETRCQAEIKESAAVTLRPPNNLAYLAALALKEGFECKIRDYPAERGKLESFIEDLRNWEPNILVGAVTTPSLPEDKKCLQSAKEICPSITTVIFGAHIPTAPKENLEKELEGPVDIAIFGEEEAVFQDLLRAWKSNGNLEKVKGILWWEGKILKRNPPHSFWEVLDTLPFPARHLLKNRLYLFPDGEAMATIQVSRGCPYQCIYCLAPIISGRKLRKRTPPNILQELKECVETYNIRRFFFRADTFTLDSQWVEELCQLILEEGLDIKWVANARVAPLKKNTLQWMKKAGCILVAFGIESGNEESLHKMRKDITLQEAKIAVKWAKEVGLKTYGFFMMGFPWETERHIQDTINFSLELPIDFAEYHIVIPYEGTPLYELCREKELIPEKVVGYDYFAHPIVRTEFVERDKLIAMRREAIKKFYFRPNYIISTFMKAENWRERINYLRRGLQVTRNLLRNKQI